MGTGLMMMNHVPDDGETMKQLKGPPIYLCRRSFRKHRNCQTESRPQGDLVVLESGTHSKQGVSLRGTTSRTGDTICDAVQMPCISSPNQAASEFRADLLLVRPHQNLEPTFTSPVSHSTVEGHLPQHQ